MDIERTEKLSITVSVLFHAFILAWLALGLGGTSAGRSAQYMAVELFESPGGAQASSGEPNAQASVSKHAAVHHAPHAAQPRPRVVEAPAPVVKKVQEEVTPTLQEVKEDISAATEISLASADTQDTESSSPVGAILKLDSSSDSGVVDGMGQAQPGGDGGLIAVREARIGEIRMAIQSAVVYPLIARRRGLEGTVLASFIVDEKGIPHDVQVLQSSGYSIFDREVVRVIHAASPYPTVDVAVEVPVTFLLSDIASR